MAVGLGLFVLFLAGLEVAVRNAEARRWFAGWVFVGCTLSAVPVVAANHRRARLMAFVCLVLVMTASWAAALRIHLTSFP